MDELIGGVDWQRPGFGGWYEYGCNCLPLLLLDLGCLARSALIVLFVPLILTLRAG